MCPDRRYPRFCYRDGLMRQVGEDPPVDSTGITAVPFLPFVSSTSAVVSTRLEIALRSEACSAADMGCRVHVDTYTYIQIQILGITTLRKLVSAHLLFFLTVPVWAGDMARGHSAGTWGYWYTMTPQRSGMCTSSAPAHYGSASDWHITLYDSACRRGPRPRAVLVPRAAPPPGWPPPKRGEHGACRACRAAPAAPC